jgi:hypothetical protein
VAATEHRAEAAALRRTVPGACETADVPTGQVSAADDHLKRLVGAQPLAGIAELVWNAFDAEARSVTVDVELADGGAVDRVVVADDGHGFTADEVPDLFSTVGGSWKHERANRMTRNDVRLLHGDKGQGRWRAFAIGDRVRWEATTGRDSERETVTVSMSQDHLEKFEWFGPVRSGAALGTTVVVDAGMKRPTRLLADDAADELRATFALWLKNYPDIELTYRGEPLTPDPLVERTATFVLDVAQDHGPAELTIIEWSIDQDRGLYLCDANGATLHKLEPGIHAPGFVFTAYVSWEGFREHESTLLLAEMHSSSLVSDVIEAARDQMRAHFRERRDEQRRSIVQQWKAEDVYPYEAEPTDPLDQASQAVFNYVATTAAPAVNTIDNRSAKKLSLSAMRVAVENDPSALQRVMRQVVQLSPDKLEEFDQLLEKTTLPALLTAMRTVVGRLDFLTALEALLFDDDLAPTVLERAHLHPLLENETWVFGEEYALHVSDKSLTTVLRAHLAILGSDEIITAPVLDSDGSHLRRVDLLFGRALEHARMEREHLVVEIKRPSVEIGRDEVSQIEDYALAVSTDSRFDQENTRWDFVLVGTTLDDHATRRANQAGQPRGLIHHDAANPNVRVWVRTWAELIHECKHRMQFVRRGLEYDPSSDEALAFIRERYPDFVPAAPTNPAERDEAAP